MLAASLMPWIDPERLGPFRPLDFVYLFFLVGALNMFVSGLILFTVANLTRSVFATYIALTAIPYSVLHRECASRPARVPNHRGHQRFLWR